MSTENPFGITKEDVLKLAVDRIVADIWRDEGGTDSTIETINAILRDRVQKEIGKDLTAKIDAALAVEMEALMGREICPVDTWGERDGSPTTLRAALHERARVFWEVKVDDKGAPSHYGGKPRYEQLFTRIMDDQFKEAVKANVTTIVGAFKDALKVDAARITREHIDNLIAVKTR